MSSVVESRCRNLKRNSEHMANQLQNAFHVELMKIPKRIRQMPIDEFNAKYGGDMQQVLAQQLKDTISQSIPPQTPWYEFSPCFKNI